MSHEPKLIIFDCDGTIVDSQHVIIGAMEKAFKAHNHDQPLAEDIRGIIGLSLHEAVAKLAPPEIEYDVLEQLCQSYKEAFIEQRQSPDFTEPLFEGARESLSALSKRDDILLGVATGKSRRGVDVLFEREGLSEFFYNIQTADDAPSKPHPGMIDNAIAQTGIAKSQAMMIGDTVFDIEMARNASIGAVGVAWGYHESDELHRAGAHRLVNRFEEIKDFVDFVAEQPQW